jgi:hypothetical protein
MFSFKKLKWKLWRKKVLESSDIEILEKFNAIAEGYKNLTTQSEFRIVFGDNLQEEINTILDGIYTYALNKPVGVNNDNFEAYKELILRLETLVAVQQYLVRLESLANGSDVSELYKQHKNGG